MKEIFIHKEDLPKSCFDCPFYDGDSDFPNMFCDVNCELLDSYEVDISTDRHENCPIKIIEETEHEGKRESGQLGNVKKAITEFSKQVQQIVCVCTVPDFNKDGKPISRFKVDAYKQIDNLKKKFCGEEQK